MILTFLISCTFLLCLVQADLDILFDECECLVRNTEYVSPDCTFEILEDSEYGNCLSTHLEILKKPPSLICSGILLGMERNGEYTQDVGLNVQMNICESLSGAPNIAHFMTNALGLAGGNCPPDVGVYENERFVISGGGESGLPESFPSGKYFLNVTMLYEEEVLVQAYLYLTVM